MAVDYTYTDFTGLPGRMVFESQGHAHRWMAHAAECYRKYQVEHPGILLRDGLPRSVRALHSGIHTLRYVEGSQQLIDSQRIQDFEEEPLFQKGGKA